LIYKFLNGKEMFLLNYYGTSSSFCSSGSSALMMIRGNNRAPIFIADEDYLFYLEKLKQGCNKHNCQIHA